MKVKIFSSRASGTVVAPPSKSMAHRALICAALGDKSSISGISDSDDITATLGCLKALGAGCSLNEGTAQIGGFNPFEISDGTELYCAESGSTLRFLIPLCMLSNTNITLKGSDRLFERPLTVYEQIAKDNAVLFKKDKNSLTVCGKLKAGEYKVRGDISSQFISGLMFALPLLEGDSSIEILGSFESASYVELTLSCLKDFGIQIKRENNTFYIKGNQQYKGCDYSVEGDYSNAAFLDGFNLIGGDVKVEGINEQSLQGDRVYRDIYARLLKGEKEFDLANCPDLAPVLFALSSRFGAVFTSTVRLKIKESDRAEAMQAELSKLGIKIDIKENSAEVFKGELKAPKVPICSHNDHRIVMAMSLLLSLTGGEIEGAQAVNKSYPDFFKVLKTLKIGMEIYED